MECQESDTRPPTNPFFKLFKVFISNVVIGVVVISYNVLNIY